MDSEKNYLKELVGARKYGEIEAVVDAMKTMSENEELKEINVESFWGAIACLLLYQVFGYIIFQAFLYYLRYPVFFFFGIIWILVFMIANAVTFKKIQGFLEKNKASTALRTLREKDDFAKFVLTVIFGAIFILFAAGYYPFPQTDYTVLTLVFYYIFVWVASYLISRLLRKTAPSIKVTKSRSGLALGFGIGVVFFLVSYFIATPMFYVHGMIGVGVCILISSAWLLADQIKTPVVSSEMQ